MKAIIVHYEEIAPFRFGNYSETYDGEGGYLLVRLEKFSEGVDDIERTGYSLNAKYAKSRKLAETALLENTKLLYDYAVTKVYSNGVLIWENEYKRTDKR